MKCNKGVWLSVASAMLICPVLCVAKQQGYVQPPESITTTLMTLRIKNANEFGEIKFFSCDPPKCKNRSFIAGRTVSWFKIKPFKGYNYPVSMDETHPVKIRLSTGSKAIFPLFVNNPFFYCQPRVSFDPKSDQEYQLTFDGSSHQCGLVLLGRPTGESDAVWSAVPGVCYTEGGSVCNSVSDHKTAEK